METRLHAPVVYHFGTARGCHVHRGWGNNYPGAAAFISGTDLILSGLGAKRGSSPTFRGSGVGGLGNSIFPVLPTKRKIKLDME